MTTLQWLQSWLIIFLAFFTFTQGVAWLFYPTLNLRVTGGIMAFSVMISTKLAAAIARHKPR